MKARTKLIFSAGLLGAAAFGLPTAAQTTGSDVLSSLSKGEWTIRFRGGSQERKICIRTGQELVQLSHSGLNCSRFVVEDGDNQMTIQYTCPGQGYGRTSVRRETASLVQIESQGIASDGPFQMTAEARRTGSCR